MKKEGSNVEGVVVGVAAWLISGLLLLINWRALPPEVPLLYSLPTGEQQLISKPWLLVVFGGFGLLMWGNIMLSWLSVKNEELLKKYLIWGGAVAEVLWLLTLLKLMEIIL